MEEEGEEEEGEEGEVQETQRELKLDNKNNLDLNNGIL
jgi:hypothetical protein